MASKEQLESWTEEVICPICLDFFSNPVILECGHNFCRSCITQCWEREERNSCPECREEFADRTLRINRALASLSEKARKLNLNPKKESKLHCEKHQEELKLFCQTDKKLICVICAAAREHKRHSYLPIEEAVQTCKDRVKSSLKTLTKKKSAIEKMEQQQKRKISDVRELSDNLQSHIASVFAELHKILTEKEQCLLRDLREDEEKILNTMETNLRVIQKQLNSIQGEIAKLQEQIDQNDSLIFLKEESQKRSMSDEHQTLSVAGGALSVGKFNHILLLNRELKQMVNGINRVSVTLDVATAHPLLEIPKDLKSVRWTGTRRDLQDTRKRFTFWSCVLGSMGFTSGRHYWEVEVAGNGGWSLGVAAESVERKGQIELRPETGFWTIGRWWDDGISANSSPRSRLPADPVPGRVGVYLNYESGTVTFYSADTKSLLHTFTGNEFTGKLYPFFRTGDVNQWLRICSGSVPDL